jgi:hypothetical protein
MTESARAVEHRELDQRVQDSEPRADAAEKQRDELLAEHARKATRDALLKKYARKPVHHFIQADAFMAEHVDGRLVPCRSGDDDEDGDAIFGSSCVFELRNCGDIVRIQVPYDADPRDVRRVLPKLEEMIDHILFERDSPGLEPPFGRHTHPRHEVLVELDPDEPASQSEVPF